jgi:cytochrome b pre-mRNA-processing protein 3
MLQKLFRPRRGRLGQSLYEQAVRQARDPRFYTRLGVADRIDARFELYTLHVLLLTMRLGEEGEHGVSVGQELFDTYVSALDHALRELGVGDLSVGKKMRKLGEALYGRMTAWETALRANDAEELTQSLARNIYEDDAAPGARLLADYALASRSLLADQPFNAVLEGPRWAEVEERT